MIDSGGRDRIRTYGGLPHTYFPSKHLKPLRHSSENELYKTTITETLEFVKNNLTNDEGAFYSSLDADSNTALGELEEGAYYVWTKEELKPLLGLDYDVFADYYNVNNYGFWEHQNYVLIRNDSTDDIVKKYSLTNEELSENKGVMEKLCILETFFITICR